MKPRPLRIRSIPEQYIEDVFDQLYRLDSVINDGNNYQRNYVVTRLVTIIEQFFRIIVEDKLYERNGRTPEPINLDPSIIDEIASIHYKEEREITKELVISLNYKFQSGDQIKKTMKAYGMKIFHGDVKKADYDELFELRHKIVHTFEQPPSQIRKYYDLTEKLFKHVLEQANIKHPSFYLLKIEALVDLGYYDKAVECFKAADHYSNDPPGKSPKNALVYYDRAMALQHLGEYEKAIDDFDRVVNLAKDNGVLYSYRGMRLQKSKNNDGISLQELAEYHKGTAYSNDPPGKSPKNALVYYDRAMALQHLGEYEKAIDDFDRVVNLAKDNGVLYSYRGMRLQKSKNNDGISLQELAEYHKGTALQEINDHNAAIKCFNRVLKMDPSDIEARLAKGESLIKLGNPAEARECLRNSIWVAEPIDAFEYYKIATLLLGMDDLDESAKCFTKALTLFNDKTNSGDGIASYGKGLLLQDLGDDEAAIKCFDKSIETDPNDTNVYVSKGMSLLKLGKYVEAKDCFGLAAKVGLNNAYAYFGLGMSPLMLNEGEAATMFFAQALGLFDMMLKVEPNDARLYHYKGAVLQGLSRPEAALECFDKAIELDPNYTDAYRSKGNLLQELGDHDDSTKCFSRITKFDKRRRSVKKIVDRLMEADARVTLTNNFAS